MTDYLARLAAMNQETPKRGTLKTIETPPEASIEGFEGSPLGHIRARSRPQDDPLAPCPTCGCATWHRIQSAGDWWCSACWPPDLLPLAYLTVPPGPQPPKELEA